jgi:hypothetical protein
MPVGVAVEVVSRRNPKVHELSFNALGGLLTTGFLGNAFSPPPTGRNPRIAKVAILRMALPTDLEGERTRKQVVIIDDVFSLELRWRVIIRGII